MKSIGSYADLLVVYFSEEVRGEVVRSLIKLMGINKMAIFVREHMMQKMDYFVLKD